jgi:hypothetical protein
MDGAKGELTGASPLVRVTPTLTHCEFPVHIRLKIAATARAIAESQVAEFSKVDQQTQDSCGGEAHMRPAPAPRQLEFVFY